MRNDVSVTQANIGYLPTINAPATELSTVNEVLTKCLNIRNQLHLEDVTCVFDQVMSANAAEIVWSKVDFKPVIIRMGVFHAIYNMMFTLRKRSTMLVFVIWR